MKRVILSVAAIALVLSVTACAQPAPEPAPAPPAKKCLDAKTRLENHKGCHGEQQ
ncbi:hypothetical protein [Methylovirgula sp. 4M-Z18]|uniref:hypothetical protein n=1 Tax=Methylovirgula sp. 4M-Z18 TaxID=2293567 RepID=UPI0018F72577|nr:hypothetical protein [Methylovirgula sp. 4M-Z18]